MADLATIILGVCLGKLLFSIIGAVINATIERLDKKYSKYEAERVEECKERPREPIGFKQETIRMNK